MNTIETQKKLLCDVSHKLWQKGWVAANDGNITVLLDDNTILATPTGVSKIDMTPDMIVRIDRQGNILERNGDFRPSTEIKMHLRCFDKREDVRAVVHAHPPRSYGFCSSTQSNGHAQYD